MATKTTTKTNTVTANLKSSGAVDALKAIANKKIAASAPVASTPKTSSTSVQKTNTGSTAQFGDQGQYTYNVDTSGVPFGAPINAATIGKTTKANIPPVPQQQNYSSTLTSLGASFGAQPGGLIPQQQTTTVASEQENKQAQDMSMADSIKQILGVYQAPTNTAELYAQAEKDAGIQQKQQVVNSLTNQLNAISAKAQADQLSVTGQGRGIPEVIIGGQQAQISKEAAIQALPVSAQLSAAQGDLESAQNHLDSYFKLIVADAQAQTDYYNKSVDMAYNLFDKKEQRQLDAIKDQKNSDTQTMRDAVNFAQSLALQALQNGDSVALKGLTSIVPPDPNSKTFQQDLVKFNNAVASYGGGLARTVRSGMNTGGSSTKIVKINGTDYVQNADGSFSLPNVPGQPSNVSASLEQIDTVNSLLNNKKGLKASVGTTSLFGRGGNVDFGSARNDFNASIQQLTAQLTLGNLINAKANGATFGALSEGELKLLDAGATKLNTWAKKDKNGNITAFKTSEANVKRELDKINNYAKKDYVLKGGDPAQVGAQLFPDGTVWVTNSDGTLTQLQ